MGLTYARGPKRLAYGIAGSAFSKGDVLVRAADSRISRAPLVNEGLNPATGDIVGIALVDSDDTEPYPTDSSGRTQVTYLVAERHTVFWSDLTDGSTSSFSPGTAVDLAYANSNTFAVASTNTPIFRITQGGGKGDIDQSETSRIQGMFDPSYLEYQS